MALAAITWVMMLSSIVLLWGVGGWAMYRTLADEDRKVKLIERQGTIDTYSPTALRELRNWIDSNPADPYHREAVDRHDECVEALRENDESFYDWTDAEIESLETIGGGSTAD
ncbi:hypothetical protein [Natrinema sp. SYSU A 869]|uniref:hypothetical protein n=1 Tax=Natrinema sp. SYSU A 869 TaxID=2871694 RepID=UPI001CA4409F|nr:hypothetical protein [Natrinema sp. SYSU A 869]